MGRGFYPLLRDMLLAHNCVFIRQGKGSHEIWQSSSGKRFSVPVTVIAKPMANAILRQAGVTEKI